MLVAETKRLTGLLYLYSRIDHLGPQDPCISQLTSQILSLIPQIPLRTNTVLWPLFMVSVLGVQPECDQDRVMVLERLDALQQRRQLGNVRKARDIMEKVWNMRDLEERAVGMGWEILEFTSKQEKISLG